MHLYNAVQAGKSCIHLPRYRCAHAQNNKDYFDQSLDEIKLLKYVNSMDPNDEYAVVRLYDFFYYKVRLYAWCGVGLATAVTSEGGGQLFRCSCLTCISQ